MRVFIVTVILLLLFVLIRLQFAPGVAASGIDPVLVGYGALFTAGFVLGELIRPLLGTLSASVRFAVIAIIAALSWSGYQYIKQETPSDVPVLTAAALDTPIIKEAQIPLAWDGHFRSVAQIDGGDLGVMIDTGAALVLLRYDEAERIGIDISALDFDTPVSTAGGRAEVALIQLASVRIGNVELEFVDAAVAPEGALQSNLIGMSFLRRLSETRIRGDRLTLRK